MKFFFICIGLLIASIGAHSQAEPAKYRTAVNRLIHFYNQQQADSIFNMFDSNVKKQLPAAQNRAVFSQLYGSLGNLQKATLTGLAGSLATYKADFDKSTMTMKLQLDSVNRIAGLLFNNYEAKAATAPAGDPLVNETPFTYKGLNGTIYGTLAMPKNAGGKVPVILIIAGSGPTDRNGNSPALGLNGNTYQQLAYALAKSGIASLRYDKRGIGQSANTTPEKFLRFDDYVDDAVGLINQLHDDPKFSKVIIFGHSEGSLIGMLSAVDEPAAGFISAAGAGIMADKILTEQLKDQPEFIRNNFKTVLDSMRKGKTNDNVDPKLYSVIRPGIQPYLMSWFRHDPQRDIKRLKIPVLIVQGSNDVQVGVSDAEKLKKGKSDATLVIITGMNHILKQAPLTREQNLATYNQPDLPLDPTLVTSVVSFVKKI